MKPTLRIHTHWQVAQSGRIPLLAGPKSMVASTLGRKESRALQHLIKAIASEVVKLRSLHSLNFCGVG